eukprot:Blabericola_migrator_1__1617@NODE_1432_length_4553_cov_330_083370_g952_i0_p5_GENE_NODE_1432_length_4553_cov_330_083370_g952_i0NODE_1432_length_4553_cov_330_083370_g952_i0_p5_ORF_typecomplete_len116_score6_19FAM53/PF15242_6/0_035_NODE_1432_length_4553_cov_330_083370_g952_i015991946
MGGCVVVIHSFEGESMPCSLTWDSALRVSQGLPGPPRTFSTPVNDIFSLSHFRHFNNPLHSLPKCLRHLKKILGSYFMAQQEVSVLACWTKEDLKKAFSYLARCRSSPCLVNQLC